MTRRGVVRSALGITAVGILVAGCMALPKPHAALFQDPPLGSHGTVPLTAGMMTLVDARPAQGRQEFPEFGELTEQVTLQILMDWSESRLFKDLYRVKEPKGADIVIRGELRAFQWQPRYRWQPYVPGFAFLATLGVPVARSAGEVEIAVDILDPRKPGTIASYTQAARRTRQYWVYRYQDFSAGDDLDGDTAFRQVLAGLQAAILEDRERIVAAARPGS
jgi:hypothetical protein